MKNEFFYIKLKAIIGTICFVGLSIIGKFFPIVSVESEFRGYYITLVIFGMIVSLYYILAYVIYLDFKNRK